MHTSSMYRHQLVRRQTRIYGKYKLVVEAWHQVVPGSNQKNKSEQRQGTKPALIKRYVIPRSDVIRDTWSSSIVTDKSHQLQYSIRVICAAKTDRHCLTECEAAAAQTNSGQYRCMEDGLIECLPGWTGDKCNVPICKSGCHPLFGYCVRPNECLCKIGYGGDLCESCTPLPGCLHGTCNKSFECLCDPGWTGLFCNQPTCADGCDSSRGYCTVPDECSCRVGWTGENCSECQLLPGCIQGYCNEPLECKCRDGWTGFFCERAICSDGCSREHGYCEKPGVCRCELGWHGEECDKCFPYPGCVHGDCSQPWQCECHANWTGFLCDKPIDPCGYEPDYCHNEGICQNTIVHDEPAASCKCREGFAGDRCQNKEENATDSTDYNTTALTTLATATVNDDLEAGASSAPAISTIVPYTPNVTALSKSNATKNITRVIDSLKDTLEPTKNIQNVNSSISIADANGVIVHLNATVSSSDRVNKTSVSHSMQVSDESEEVLTTEGDSPKTSPKDTSTSPYIWQKTTGTSNITDESDINSTTSRRSERKVDGIHSDLEKKEVGADGIDVESAPIDSEGTSLNTADQAQVIADNIKFVISSFKRMAKNMLRPSPPDYSHTFKVNRRDKLKNRRHHVVNAQPHFSHTSYSASPRYKYSRRPTISRHQDTIQPRSRNTPFSWNTLQTD